jgi:predicted TIM-barrel fold metal-dependent hydrolase
MKNWNVGGGPARNRAATVREELRHPIVDSDGHIVELMPAFLDYLQMVAGKDAVVEFQRTAKEMSGAPLSTRQEFWLPRGPFWGVPSKNTLDRMTVGLPKLLHERMPELGLDFAVLFPTIATLFLWGRGGRSELDLAGCRAYNEFVADQFRPYSDRMTPAAIIPMYTPADAIAELEHAASLGLKVALLAPFVMRPIPGIAKAAPAVARHFMRLDAFGIDSPYDYDPVWAKCIELKFPVMMHGFAIGFTDRTSPTNYVANHMGHFAAAQEVACRSLFMAGVTRRFPALKFGFLEGGVAWGSRLLNDIAGRWRKRNVRALRENLDPALLDKELAKRLCEQYGDERVRAKILDIVASLPAVMALDPSEADQLDEFAACGIERIEDLQSRFVDSFFFGCEADDPLVATAFLPGANPLGTALKPLFGSDMGHWDVVDLTDPVVEAYELVEHGQLDESQFRAFVCDNAIDVCTSLNGDFFAGTALNDYARARFARRPSG